MGIVQDYLLVGYLAVDELLARVIVFPSLVQMRWHVNHCSREAAVYDFALLYGDVDTLLVVTKVVICVDQVVVFDVNHCLIVVQKVSHLHILQLYSWYHIFRG